MTDHNPDDFYEGPPVDEPGRWHDGGVLRPSAGPGADVEDAATEPTADPSLSRAVDRAAAGRPVEADGYDRRGEGSPPGPLDPEASD